MQVNKFIKKDKSNSFIIEPIILEKYNLTESSSTIVMLNKIEEIQGVYYTLTAMNLVLIKNKILVFNYVLKYLEKGSINTLKTNNNNLLNELIKLNNQ